MWLTWKIQEFGKKNDNFLCEHTSVVQFLLKMCALRYLKTVKYFFEYFAKNEKNKISLV